MRIIFVFALMVFQLNGAVVRNITRINDNENRSAQKSPNIAFSEDGSMYCVWVDFRDGHDGELYFSRSIDNGRNWDENKRLISTNITNSQYQRFATIKAYGDNVYVCWMARVNGQIDVFFTASNDKGNTFRDPIIISDDNSEYNQDFPMMEVDDNGVIHVSFLDARGYESKEKKYVQMMYTKSSDNGTTWTTNKAISHYTDFGGACECCWPSLDTYKLGDDIHVAINYRSNIDNLRVFYVAYSSDGGENFDEPVRIGFQDWMIDYCPVSGADVVFDNEGTLHSSYYVDGKLYYNKFSKINNVDNNEVDLGYGNNPEINVVNDKIIVLYEAINSGKLLNFITSSNINAVDFTDPEITIQGYGAGRIEFNRTIVKDEKVYMVWQDNVNGTNYEDIWFGELFPFEVFSSIKEDHSDIFEIIENRFLIKIPFSNISLTEYDMLGRVKRNINGQALQIDLIKGSLYKLMIDQEVYYFKY